MSRAGADVSEAPAGSGPFCPRCGESWVPGARCPGCGYEHEHPGVLGAYRQGLGLMVRRPAYFVPFLLPVAILAIVQLTTAALDVEADPSDLRAAVINLVQLFLTAWWYFVAVGTITPAVISGTRRASASPSMRMGLVPTGPVIVGSALASVVMLAPWVAITGILLLQPKGVAGAFGLLAAMVLIIASIIVAGRVVGLPVEAALRPAAPMAMARAGSDRARENGGLGLMFLAVVLLVLMAFVPVVFELAGVPLPTAALAAIGIVGSLVVGTWAGIAFVKGLAGHEARTGTFTCPRCGAQASAWGGRAQCSCGLEGPFYEA